jgi:hypothetical protein
MNSVSCREHSGRMMMCQWFGMRHHAVISMPTERCAHAMIDSRQA